MREDEIKRSVGVGKGKKRTLKGVRTGEGRKNIVQRGGREEKPESGHQGVVE